MAKTSVCFAACMNVVSRAMTSSADCSPSARKNTERSSIDEMPSWLAKADNAICTTHTTWKCLILLPMNYASGAIPSFNLWPIISAIFAIATCIVTCLQAGFANRIDPALPSKGTDFDDLLKVFREAIVPFSRQNAHPRMFGYVQSPGTPLAGVC